MGPERLPRITGTSAGLFVVLMMGACSLSPKPDPSRFFVLSSLREMDTAATAADGQVIQRLGVGPVTFPAYLTRGQMVTRLGDNEIRMSEIDRWAEPLDEEFRRVLAENLSVLVPAGSVVMFPWHRSLAPDVSVRVEVLRFERRADGAAELLARWWVRTAGGEGMPREASIRIPSESPGTPGSVAAQSTAIAELARDIAGSLRGAAR